MLSQRNPQWIRQIKILRGTHSKLWRRYFHYNVNCWKNFFLPFCLDKIYYLLVIICANEDTWFQGFNHKRKDETKPVNSRYRWHYNSILTISSTLRGNTLTVIRRFCAEVGAELRSSSLPMSPLFQNENQLNLKSFATCEVFFSNFTCIQY